MGCTGGDGVTAMSSSPQGTQGAARYGPGLQLCSSPRPAPPALLSWLVISKFMGSVIQGPRPATSLGAKPSSPAHVTHKLQMRAPEALPMPRTQRG